MPAPTSSERWQKVCGVESWSCCGTCIREAPSISRPQHCARPVVVSSLVRGGEDIYHARDETLFSLSGRESAKWGTLFVCCRLTARDPGRKR